MSEATSVYDGPARISQTGLGGHPDEYDALKADRSKSDIDIWFAMFAYGSRWGAAALAEQVGWAFRSLERDAEEGFVH